MRPCIQIQPSLADPEAWAELAERENCSYEVLELSVRQDRGIDFRRAVDWYAASGRVQSLHGAFIDNNPVSGDLLIRQASAERCRESCALAKELGAENVVFHGSCFPFLRGGYLTNWAEKSAEFYQKLAEEFGLHIHMENSMDLDPTPLRELMERVSSPLVRVCLDIGHANLSRAPIAAWFEMLGPYIDYLHLSDNPGAFDDHLPMGAGTVDWAETDSLVKALGRPCIMTMEVGGVPEVGESFAFMRANHYFGF